MYLFIYLSRLDKEAGFGRCFNQQGSEPRSLKQMVKSKDDNLLVGFFFLMNFYFPSSALSFRI